MEAELWRQQAKVSKKTRVSVPLPPLNVGHKKPRGEELSKCQLRLSFSIWHTHRHTDTTQTHRHRHTHLSQSYTLPNCSCTSGPIISLCAHTRSTHARAHTHTHTHTSQMFLFVFLRSGACFLWQTAIYQLHEYSFTSQSGKLHQPPLFLQVWLHRHMDTHTHTHVSHTMVMHS